MSVSIVDGVATFTGTGVLFGGTGQLGGATSAVIVGYSSLGQNAFQNASGLTSITIPTTMKSLGISSLSGTGLTSLLIPASVTNLSQAFLWATNNLATITFEPNSLLNEISSQAFRNATGLTSITIPNSVTKINNQAFSSTGKLTSINIPSSVTSIGSDAFISSGLLIATISTSTSYSVLGLTNTISQQPFFGKTDVLVVTPNTKIYNGTGALTNAIVTTDPLGDATSVAIVGYSSIGANAFTARGITSIGIQSSVTSIGAEAFIWTPLKSIILPSSVTSIADRCFQNSGSLTSITINSSAISIGGGGVFANTGLTTATFQTRSSIIALGLTSTNSTQSFFGKNGVKVIALDTKIFTGPGTDGSLTNATSQLSGKAIVNIEGYISIGANAFQDASGVTSITISSSVTSIGENAFQGSGLTTATFAVSTYFSTFGLTISNSPQTLFGKLNVLVISNDVRLFKGTGVLTNATAQLNGATHAIIQDYTSIGDGAFIGAINLTSIDFQSPVTSIGASAFHGTGFNSLIIPSSVTRLGDFLFRYAVRLTSVTIPASVTSIGSSIFADSALTTAIFVKSSNLSVFNVSVGSGKYISGRNNVTVSIITKVFNGSGALTNATSNLQGATNAEITGYSSIGENAFQDASGVTLITIPSNMTSIGASAFQGMSGLTSVTIPSAVSSIASDAFLGSGVTSATFAVSTYFSTFDLTITDSPQPFFGKSNVVVTTLDTKVFNDIGELTGATAQLGGATNVIIKGYTSIGQNAFQNAIGLKSITIPSTVANIGNSAFSNSGLTSLLIPASVISFGQGIVWNTNNLKTITFAPNSLLTQIGYRVFMNATGVTSINIPNGVTLIERDAFRSASSLTSITIPSSVTSIDSTAFEQSGLTTATFPTSSSFVALGLTSTGSTQSFFGKSGVTVTTLDTKIFSGSGSLTNATAQLNNATSVIIYGYSSIGANAFQDASGVTSITIPSSVNSIGESAFQGMSNLPEITVDSTNNYYSSDNGILFNKLKTIIIQYPLGNTRTRFTIPSSVTRIGASAFQGASALTSITIPSSVISIDNNAFHSSGITSVIFEESTLLDGLGITPGINNTLGGKSGINISWITKVFNDSGVLSDAVGLLYGATNARIETYSSIGANAFQDASGVTSVTIPSSVTSIGDWAFANATSLISLSIPFSVTSIGDNAFYSTTSLLEFTVDVNNNTYKSDTYGGLFNKTQTTIIQYPAGNVRTSYEIPSSVTSVGTYAFHMASNLTSVTVPATVTNISAYAFFNVSSLSSINFALGPDESLPLLNSIGNGAFQGASALTSITLPVSATIIGVTAFQSSGLTSALVESALYLDSIDIPVGDLITGYTVPLFFGKSSVTVRYNEAKLAFISAAPTAVTSDSTFTTLLTSLDVNISNITSEIVPLTNDPYVEYSATLTIPEGDLSTLTDIDKANIIDTVTVLYAAQLGVAINKVIVTLSSGSIIINVNVLNNDVTEAMVPICFPKGTPVTTNQGDIAIEKLNPDIHTIRGKKIVAITQSRPLHKYIISIEKDAFGKNVPSAPIQISKEHKVFYKGEMVKAKELVEVCEGVTRIPYNGKTLYNVLMEKHDKMMINNVICETLDPKNIMAKICCGKYNRVEQAKICKELNDIIKADNVSAYKKLYASLK